MKNHSHLVPQFLEWAKQETGLELKVDGYFDELKEHRGDPYFHLEIEDRVWASPVFDRLLELAKESGKFTVEGAGTHRLVVICEADAFLNEDRIKLFRFYESFLSGGSSVVHWIDRFFEADGIRFADTGSGQLEEGDLRNDAELGGIALRQLAREVPADEVKAKAPKYWADLCEFIGGADPYNPPAESAGG